MMYGGEWYKGAKDWHLTAFLILGLIGLISILVLIALGAIWLFNHVTIT